MRSTFFFYLDGIGEIAVAEGLADLIVEVDAVGHDENDRVFELLFLAPQLYGGKEHGQRLA